MNFIFNEAKELVRLAGEEVGETTSTGSSVYTPFKQQMSTPDMLMNAGIVILVVFGVLFIMYVLISLAGKILATATKDSGKKPEELVKGRYADSLEPAFEKTKKELGDKARSDEDVLSYIAFPQVAEKFFAAREEKESNTVNYTIEKKED